MYLQRTIVTNMGCASSNQRAVESKSAVQRSTAIVTEDQPFPEISPSRLTRLFGCSHNVRGQVNEYPAPSDAFAVSVIKYTNDQR